MSNYLDALNSTSVTIFFCFVPPFWLDLMPPRRGAQTTNPPRLQKKPPTGGSQKNEQGLLAACAHRFVAFGQMIAPLFRTQTRDVSPHARHHLQGLLSQLPRKNRERMGEALPDVRHADLQHFLSDSPWSAPTVWPWVGPPAQAHLGGPPATRWVVDESAFAKKGDRSVGVARQYNGRLGQTDHCQVGVCSALAHGPRAALVGSRLSLPEAWVQDPARRRAAGVPLAEIQARTKIDLARDLVNEARAHDLDFAWVGVDAGDGRDPSFLVWLAAQGHGVVADVPADLRVWEEEPTEETRPARRRASGAERVDALGARWRAVTAGTWVRLRTGENGVVRARVWTRQVWW